MKIILTLAGVVVVGSQLVQAGVNAMANYVESRGTVQVEIKISSPENPELE